MSDMEDVEELQFLPAGETTTSSSKRHKYEPRLLHRCRNVACSKPVLQVCLLVTTIIAVSVTVTLVQQRHRDDDMPTSHEGVKPHTKGILEATNGEIFPWSDIRLPTTIKPLTYDIHMHPDLVKFKFSGSVEIKFEVLEPSDFIVFHVKDLTVDRPTVKDAEGQGLQVVKYLENKEHEQAYVRLASQLGQHKQYRLLLTFHAELLNAMTGFYRSSYKTAAGVERWIATTHFEPTDARAAFPCFDEPDLKANFTMRLTHAPGYYGLFNTPLMSTKRDKGQDIIEDTFEESVRMSTYLVAFIVCDYKHNGTITSKGTKVSVHTPPDHIGQATFGLQVATVVLQYYEQFFGVPYPLPKVDLVAIPDFAAGAMENWGLITYRMTALLYEEGVSSTRNQQRVAIVVAHELAHQWFGNLVTMKWWNDLWLNEGFASFVEYLGTNKFNPDWKMMDLFVSETLTTALYRDSLASSHPISVPVHNPAEINEIFDVISYDKGASIIRMLKSVLGMSALEKGLQYYLNKFKYSNAVTDDLWNCLSHQTAQQTTSVPVDAKVVMATWTGQMGYPLVSLSQTGRSVVASQKRFLLDEGDAQTSSFTSPYGYTWHIPLTFKTDQSAMELRWMNRTGVSFDVPAGAKWLKANVDMNGFYRVQYTERNWRALISQLKDDHTVFSSADRASLLDDAFALARHSRAGHLDLSVAMDMSTYLHKETEYLPWEVALQNLAYIEEQFALTPAHKVYAAFILKLLDQHLKSVKWEDEGTHLEKYMRILVLKEAVRLNHQPSVKTAKDLFYGWMNKSTSVVPDLKDVVYVAGVQYGGAAEWNFMWQRYEATTVPSEKRKTLHALAATTNAVALQRFLQRSLIETQVRKGDTVTVVRSVASKPAGQVLAWHFVKKNWDIFYKRYGTGSFAMSRLIVTSAGGFASEFAYNEVESFFKSHDAGSGKRAVTEALERIRMNTAWRKQHMETLTQWLTQHTA